MNKSNFNSFKNFMDRTKYISATIVFVVSSITGAYHFTSNYFVTTAYAQELKDNFHKTLQELKEQTSMNTLMIIEDRLLRYEKRVQKGQELTPTEKRQYERLMNLYDKKMNELNLTK